jgi:hypothetical protein
MRERAGLKMGGGGGERRVMGISCQKRPNTVSKEAYGLLSRPREESIF